VAFHYLKQCLTTASILKRPNWNEPFILYTDASAKGFGAVLAQKQNDKERVIRYASSSTVGAEKFYGATKLELRAVIWAVELFRHYLTGRKFTIITDHTALTSLMHQKQLSGIFARWVLKLQEFDFDIKYRKGRLNGNADALSRINWEKVAALSGSAQK